MRYLYSGVAASGIRPGAHFVHDFRPVWFLRRGGSHAKGRRTWGDKSVAGTGLIHNRFGKILRKEFFGIIQPIPGANAGLAFSLKHIIHFYSSFTEVGGMNYTGSDQVMQRRVRVGIGADGHAPAAVGPDSGPVGIALFCVDPPSQAAVRLLYPGPFRYRMRGAVRDAFLAVLTKIDHGRVKGMLINQKRGVIVVATAKRTLGQDEASSTIPFAQSPPNRHPWRPEGQSHG